MQSAILCRAHQFMNLLPSVEAYCTERIAQLAKFHPKPAPLIDELERVRTLCRGMELQQNLWEQVLSGNRPSESPQDRSRTAVAGSVDLKAPLLSPQTKSPV